MSPVKCISELKSCDLHAICNTELSHCPLHRRKHTAVSSFILIAARLSLVEKMRSRSGSSQVFCSLFFRSGDRMIWGQLVSTAGCAGAGLQGKLVMHETPLLANPTPALPMDTAHPDHGLRALHLEFVNWNVSEPAIAITNEHCYCIRER